MVTMSSILQTQATAAGIGGSPSWTTKTADYTSASGDKILADTITTNDFTVTLPASPTVGQSVIILDATGNAATDNIYVSARPAAINITPNTSGSHGFGDANSAFSERFQATSNGLVSQVTFRMAYGVIGTGSVMQCRLFSDSGLNPGSLIETSATVLNTTDLYADPHYRDIKFEFTTNSLTSGTFYHAVLNFSTYTSANVRLLYGSGGPGTGGRYSTDNGSSWNQSGLDYRFTVRTAGEKINSTSNNDIILDVNDASAEFVYYSATYGWKAKT